MLFIVGKQIQRKRLLPGLQFLHHGIKIGKGQNRQDGAENFLAHNGVLFGYGIHDRGSNLTGGGIGLAAEHHLLFVNQAAKTVEMLFVDDSSIILVFKRTVPVLPLNFRTKGLYKFVLDRTLAEDIVGSHAGLAAVEKFAENDPSGRKPDRSA